MLRLMRVCIVVVVGAIASTWALEQLGVTIEYVQYDSVIQSDGLARIAALTIYGLLGMFVHAAVCRRKRP